MQEYKQFLIAGVVVFLISGMLLQPIPQLSQIQIFGIMGTYLAMYSIGVAFGINPKDDKSKVVK